MGVQRGCKGHPAVFLNGRPILLNGLLDQGYWPDGLYTPPSDTAVEHELHTVRELGFNLLRKHAKIEPERWYYHCDKLGIIVWQDMVNGGGAYPMWYVTYLTNALQPLMRHAPDGKLLWGFLGRGSAHSREEYARELADTVAALGRHPCIGCWVPFNEGWGSSMHGKRPRPSAPSTRPVRWTRPAAGSTGAGEMCIPSTTTSIRSASARRRALWPSASTAALHGPCPAMSRPGRPTATARPEAGQS